MTDRRNASSCGCSGQYQPRCLRAIRLPALRRGIRTAIAQMGKHDITHFVRRAAAGIAAAPARNALTSRKIHGQPCAARPSITPSAPVKSSTARAFSGVSMSPLAITGMRTACLTAAIVSYSASPAEATGARAAVHGERWMPASSASRAMLTRIARAAIPAGADLQRHRHVDGLHDRLEDRRDQRLVARAAPSPASLLQTFFAGQPMLMSMICAPRSTLARAASASLRRIVACELHDARFGLALVIARGATRAYPRAAGRP